MFLLEDDFHGELGLEAETEVTVFDYRTNTLSEGRVRNITNVTPGAPKLAS